MEFFHRIRTELRITGEKKQRERMIRSLEKFFETPEGQRHLDNTLKTWNISKSRKKGVEPVDNKISQFRLITETDNQTFMETVRAKEPKRIKYKITNQRDEFDAGDLLIEADNKVAIKTSGIIFPQTSGIEGLFSQLHDLGYRRGETEPAPHVFQPWQEIVKRS